MCLCRLGNELCGIEVGVVCICRVLGGVLCYKGFGSVYLRRFGNGFCDTEVVEGCVCEDLGMGFGFCDVEFL